MPLPLRLLLVAGALLSFLVVARKIKKSKILMGDAIFWVVLSLVFVVIAIFPQIAFFFADLFGFISPSNFVFLVIIALLLMKVFGNTIEISLLKHQVRELAQEIALSDDHENRV